MGESMTGEHIPLIDLVKGAAVGNYTAEDAPDYGEILRCTHCGLCLENCPTYRILGLEADSPRGRIYQMRAVAEDRYEVNADFAEHMNVCLACRACETACPATIGYGQLVEAARWQAVATLPMGWRERLLRSLVFRQLFPYPRRLRVAARLLWLYQRTGLQHIIRRTGLLNRLWPSAAQAETVAPRIPKRFFHPARSQFYLARGKARATVALFSGCIMPLVYGSTNEATVRVLQHNGCHVLVTEGQVCCGAIHGHAGERSLAKTVARKNIDAFLKHKVDAIIVNAAGCGVTLKEYGELLKDDPQYADKARQFSDKVKDISEFLVELGPVPPRGKVPARVTYQDACHLAHGQDVRSQPRALLKSIPGLELVEMQGSDQCCGSAGIYNLVRHDFSMKVLQDKMVHIQAVEPQAIISANPGCMLQLEIGCQQAGLHVPVLHIVDLLDRAYRGYVEQPGEPL